MAESKLGIVGEYARNRLVRECAPWGGQSRVAEATGIQTSHISRVLRGSANIGEDFLERLRVYWNLSEKQLLREAEHWHAQLTPERKPAHPEQEDAGGNRERAIAMAGERWSRQTIESLRAMVMRHDPSVGWWIDLGLKIDEQNSA